MKNKLKPFITGIIFGAWVMFAIFVISMKMDIVFNKDYNIEGMIGCGIIIILSTIVNLFSKGA